MALRSLQVYLLLNQDVRAPIWLPVEMVDECGKTLSTCVVSSQAPATLYYQSVDSRLYVRLLLPDGGVKARVLEQPTSNDPVAVTFHLEEPAYSAGVGQRSMAHAWNQAVTAERSVLDVVAESWLQIWKLTGTRPRWRQSSAKRSFLAQRWGRVACELEVGCAAHPRALVAKIGKGMPQVISLPSHPARVRVAFDKDPGSSQISAISIGGSSPVAQAILEFLEGGRLVALETMLGSESPLTCQLLSDELDEPAAATAAAYYFLRKRDWDRLDEEWLDKLAALDWSADAQIISTVSRIERGLEAVEAANLASSCISVLLQGRMPVFSEAVPHLRKLLLLSERADVRVNRSVARRLGLMLASAQPAGISFGFWGASPASPLPSSASRFDAQVEYLKRVDELEGLLTVTAQKLERIVPPPLDAELELGLLRIGQAKENLVHETTMSFVFSGSDVDTLRLNSAVPAGRLLLTFDDSDSD